MLTATSHLTPLQKAVFLGDRSASVMELLNDEDRKKLELLTRKSEKEVQIKKEKVEVKKTDPLPFEEEPLKVSNLINISLKMIFRLIDSKNMCII
jgi:hypothetical protein